MRVAQLVRPGSFRVVEQEIPEPGPGEVLARVTAVGVCGSDLHNFVEGGVGDSPAAFPMVLGHEPAGTVEKLGAGVSGIARGDRVALEPAVFCYHCEFCHRGQNNVCSNMRFLSQPGDPGFFRDYVVLPAANCLPIPANLSFGEATLFEPLAVILHSMKFVSLQMGETAAVFGAGPIGLLTIAALRMAGASRIWAVEPVAERRELAKAMGADEAIDPCQENAVRRLLAETGQRGVDVTVDCAAKGDSINHCLKSTRSAGRVVITAIPSELTVSLDFHDMRRKELALFNVRRSIHESPLALRMLSEQPHRFAPMLTHSKPLEEIESGFSMLESYRDGIGKLLIQVAP